MNNENLKKESIGARLFSMQNEDALTEAEFLQEVYRDATTGSYSVEIIKPFVKDRSLKNVLYSQHAAYKEIAAEARQRATGSEVKLDELSGFSKAMMQSSLYVNLIADKSSSRLAQIMIKGINMGIISTIKLINSLESDEEIDVSLAKKALAQYESNLNELKRYL